MHNFFWFKSLQIAIQLHCLIPSKMGNFNGPLQKPIAKLMVLPGSAWQTNQFDRASDLPSDIR